MTINAQVEGRQGRQHWYLASFGEAAETAEAAKAIFLAVSGVELGVLVGHETAGAHVERGPSRLAGVMGVVGLSKSGLK